MPLIYLLLRRGWPLRLTAVGLIAVGFWFNWLAALTAFVPILLVLMLVRLAPADWGQEDDRSVRLNVMWSLLGLLVIPLPVATGLLIRAGVPRGLPVIETPALNLETVGLGVAALLLGDLMSYLVHRAKHQIPFLWRFHEIHHSANELGPFATRRLHPVDIIFGRLGQIVPFIVIGPQYLFAFIPWVVLRTAAGYYHHSNIRLELGWFNRILVTPGLHRLHHSRLPEHFDCNYGDLFIVWDRVFRTYKTPNADLVPTGVLNSSLADETTDQSPLRNVFLAQLIAPFRRQSTAESASADTRA